MDITSFFSNKTQQQPQPQQCQRKNTKTSKNLQEKTKVTNETYGINSEVALAEENNLPHGYGEDRIHQPIKQKFVDCIRNYNGKTPLPKITKCMGVENGCTDFLTEGNNTLSLKTIQRKDGKICPQEIGQPTLKKYDEYFKLPYEGNIENNKQRWDWIKENMSFCLEEYAKKTFCCKDLMIFTNCKSIPHLEFIKKLPENYFIGKQFTYTQPEYIEKWNEKKQKYSEFSCTIKINQKSVGEFQFHKNSRKQIKFRFYKSFLNDP